MIQSRTLILSDPEAESQQPSQDDLQDYDMPSPDGQSDEDEESRDGESGGDDNKSDIVSDCNSRRIGSTRGTRRRRGRGRGRGWCGRGQGAKGVEVMARDGVEELKLHKRI